MSADYEGQRNVLNQVALWDKIIQHPDDAHIHLPYVRNKYKFVDQVHSNRTASATRIGAVVEKP